MSFINLFVDYIKILILFAIIVILLIRFYMKYTIGICKSERDLSGKVVLITGGNTGLGKEVVRDLARRNAKVILACRSIERGFKAVSEVIASTGNSNIIVKQCDISSLKSVRKLAEDIKKSVHRLDVLICFAGTGSEYGRHLTEDGIEKQFATNHLGHFLLTHLLLDLLKSNAPSRIVITSSFAHRLGVIDLDNIIRFDKYINHPFFTYCDTKLVNVMFMKELSDMLKGTGVSVNALHPGTIYTNGIRKNSFWYLKAFLTFMCFLHGKTKKEGAQTIIHLAVSEEVEGVTGHYFVDCKVANYNPIADDKELRRKLWDISAKLCQIKTDDIKVPKSVDISKSTSI